MSSLRGKGPSAEAETPPQDRALDRVLHPTSHGSPLLMVPPSHRLRRCPGNHRLNAWREDVRARDEDRSGESVTSS
ncbi:hypothetical protein GN956_G18551 [Arapaima gigas]